jgi:serine/threonine protein kinase
MKGGDLLSYLIERYNLNKPFNEYEVAHLIYQICNAVQCLHRLNIAHRDLKPENILLISHDKNPIIKISDFGFAKHTNGGLYSPCFT